MPSTLLRIPFLTIAVKTNKMTKKRPLLGTAAMAKDCLISAFPEEIKKHIGSVQVVNAKQSWVKSTFRRILVAVRVEKFFEDLFLKESGKKAKDKCQ